MPKRLNQFESIDPLTPRYQILSALMRQMKNYVSIWYKICKGWKVKNILGIMKGGQDEVDEGSEEEEGDESDEADDITGLFLQTRYGRNTTSWKRVNYR